MAVLARDVEELKWSVKTNGHLKSVSAMLVHAIGLLQKASDEGYDYIEEEFEFIWH